MPPRGTPGGAGALLRAWRQRRGMSQLSLALDSGVSARHLSFIETGRASPSAALLLRVSERLGLGLRERNSLLQAAGYARHYGERPLDDAALGRVREALGRLLDAHEPYPGLVLDRRWDVVQANRPALRLAGLLPPHVKTPTFNLFRASLHPDGLAAWTENFAEWAGHLLRILRSALAAGTDPALEALAREVSAYPAVQMLGTRESHEAPDPHAVIIPCVLNLPAGRLSMFTTLTSFGAPRDITLEELCIELFYPADDSSEKLLRLLHATAAD